MKILWASLLILALIAFICWISVVAKRHERDEADKAEELRNRLASEMERMDRKNQTIKEICDADRPEKN